MTSLIPISLSLSEGIMLTLSRVVCVFFALFWIVVSSIYQQDFRDTMSEDHRVCVSFLSLLYISLGCYTSWLFLEILQEYGWHRARTWLLMIFGGLVGTPIILYLEFVYPFVVEIRKGGKL